MHSLSPFGIFYTPLQFDGYVKIMQKKHALSILTFPMLHVTWLHIMLLYYFFSYKGHKCLLLLCADFLWKVCLIIVNLNTFI